MAVLAECSNDNVVDEIAAGEVDAAGAANGVDGAVDAEDAASGVDAPIGANILPRLQLRSRRYNERLDLPYVKQVELSEPSASPVHNPASNE